MTSNVSQIASQFTDVITKKTVIAGLVNASQNILIQDDKYSPSHFFSKKFVLQGSLPSELEWLISKIALEKLNYQANGTFSVQSSISITEKELKEGVIINMPTELPIIANTYLLDTQVRLVGWINGIKIPLSQQTYAFSYWDSTLDARIGFLSSQLYLKGYLPFDTNAISERVNSFITRKTISMTVDQKQTFLSALIDTLGQQVQKSQTAQREIVSSAKTDEELLAQISAFRREQIRIDVYNGIIMLFSTAMNSSEADTIINSVLQ